MAAKLSGTIDYVDQGSNHLYDAAVNFETSKILPGDVVIFTNAAGGAMYQKALIVQKVENETKLVIEGPTGKKPVDLVDTSATYEIHATNPTPATYAEWV